MRRLHGWLLAIALGVAGCESVTPMPPPTRTILPEIAASPTVDPVLPRIDPFNQPGRTSPEIAGVPRDSNVDLVTPLPGEVGMEIVASRDGLRMQATLYRADVEPAPAALLLHAAGGRKEDWLALVTPLQQAGFTVLAVDLRGHGRTGGAPDWTAVPQDVLDIVDALRRMDGVDAGRVAVIGAEVGANLALTTCAVNTFCSAAVAISPGLEEQGIRTEDAVGRITDRPLLLIAAEGDAAAAQRLDSLAPGPHDLITPPGFGRGTALLASEPTLPGTILAWLQGRL